MILADTSIWVQHFRRGVPEFGNALNQHQIAIHPVVRGELATGNLSQRSRMLLDLRRLPGAFSSTVDETLLFIQNYRLYRRGLGWSDVQLLAGARLSGHLLWTLDSCVAAAAGDLGIVYDAKV